MNKLLSALIAAACISTAFAADAPKPATDAKAAQSGEALVTPQSQAAALQAAIEDKKTAAKAAKGEKPAEAKK